MIRCEEIFVDRLNELLTETKTTKAKLARHIGTETVVVCRYANGERVPRVTNVVQIAEYFNVTVDYLLGVSDLRNFKKETDKLRNDSDNLLNELARIHKENRGMKHRINILEKQLEIMTLSFGGNLNERRTEEERDSR